MTSRPLTDRELEDALIALMWERDARGLLTCGPIWDLRELPAAEGWFL